MLPTVSDAANIPGSRSGQLSTSWAYNSIFYTTVSNTLPGGDTIILAIY